MTQSYIKPKGGMRPTRQGVGLTLKPGPIRAKVASGCRSATVHHRLEGKNFNPAALFLVRTRNQHRLISLYEFSVFTSLQQLEVIWQQGQFVTSRHQGAQWVNLYTMGIFFVEVFYDPTLNKITLHRTFVTDKLLLPYVSDQLLAQLMAG